MRTERPDMRNIIDEEYLKKIVTSKRLQRKNKTFLDMDVEDIKGIIEELLLELISDEHITSMSTIIPLVDIEHPSRVSLGLFTDEDSLKYTYNNVHRDNPKFISTMDITDAMVETLNETNPMMQRELEYRFMRLAHRLNIPDTFHYELKRNDIK